MKKEDDLCYGSEPICYLLAECDHNSKMISENNRVDENEVKTTERIE